MQKHKVGLKWSDTEKGLLTQSKNMLVETIKVYEMGPHILVCSDLILPLRMLTIHNACLELRGISKDQTYEVKPNSILSDQYPNMVVIPAIQITSEQANKFVPFVLINL